MGRTRKLHRKSREGCVQCKQRHAKIVFGYLSRDSQLTHADLPMQCDEVHPQCLQCARGNLSCSFTNPTLSTMPLNDDSAADLELLEHWHQFPITGDMSVATKQLQADLIKLGFSHHHLLNSILGFAALHLYSQDRTQPRWYARAAAHQHAAITRARPHLESPNQAQHQALLGFSAFTSMYAVAEPSLRPPDGAGQRPAQQTGAIDELVNAFLFARSTLTFVRQHFTTLFVSGSWLLAEADSANAHVPRHDLESRYPQLIFLLGCIERRCTGEEEQGCCRHAVTTLFQRIARLSDDRELVESNKVIWLWGLEVDQAFLDMCLARHPMALVILAYFTVLMGMNQEHWSLTHWPGWLMGDVRGELGDDWREALKWASDLGRTVGNSGAGRETNDQTDSHG